MSDVSTQPGTVLVVDDESGLRTPISEYLRASGVRVAEAASASEAITRLETDTGIRVVFSDIRMPGAMDGIGLARYVFAHFSHVYVLLTSANLPPDVDPFAPFIAKPYSLTTVAGRLMQALEGQAVKPA